MHLSIPSPLRAMLATCLLILTASLAGADPTSRLVASFSPNPNGAYLASPLIAGPGGNYYGITSAGGAYNIGTIFKITPSGVLTTLASLNPAITGQDPFSFLLASDGNFYGTTFFYGPGGQGTVFKMTPDGTLTTLHAFSGSNGPTALFQGQDGDLYTVVAYGPFVRISISTGAATYVATPPGGFTLYFRGQDGYFYGTYNVGGTTTIMKISTTGDMQTVGSVTGYVTDVIQAANGTIYGSLAASSAYPYGSIFSLGTMGAVNTLVSFQAAGSSVPLELELGQDGNFYGVGQGPGSVYPTVETIFKATPSGTVTTIATAPASGGRFYHLTQLANGNFFWDTDGIGTIQRLSQGVISTFYNFSSPDLGTPQGPIIEASNGSFYGTTKHGGTLGYGGVFQVTPNGALSTLVSFPVPFATYGLTQAGDGNFYGSDLEGATGGYDGTGSIYKVTPSGALSTLYAFTGGLDGGMPCSTLAKGTDGNLYGLSESGGANNAGTFFKVSTKGTFTVLASLDSTLMPNVLALMPPIPFVLGSDGNFYAATLKCIFKITPAGKIVVLHTFPANLFLAPGALALGQDGNIYGTVADSGGSNQGYLYRLTPKGVLTTLYNFPANFLPNGTTTLPALTLGNDGNFYIATSAPSSNSPGALTQVTPAGVGYSISYGGTAGDNPYALAQASDGTLYGLTQSGGTAASGTIFNVNADLLDGTIIGTPGSFSYQPGNSIEKVFDGNLSTYFDAPSPGNGDWVGLDLGSVQNITAIAYVPRTSFENRMIGGVFQGSTTPDFSSGVVNLAPPIKTFPGDHFNVISVNGAFRYVRYLSPDHGFGNISELQFFSGPPPSTP